MTKRAAIVTGAAAGMCQATLCLQLVLLWGTTPTVALAICAAVGIGLAAGCGVDRTVRLSTRCGYAPARVHAMPPPQS